MFKDIVNEITDPFYVDVDAVGIDDEDYRAYINLKMSISLALLSAYNKGFKQSVEQGYTFEDLKIMPYEHN
jgi:hypothetical protein